MWDYVSDRDSTVIFRRFFRGASLTALYLTPIFASYFAGIISP